MQPLPPPTIPPPPPPPVEPPPADAVFNMAPAINADASFGVTPMVQSEQAMTPAKARNTAKMAATLIDITSANFAAWFAGRESSEYKMSRQDKDDLIEVFEAYFLTLVSAPSPGSFVMFAVFTHLATISLKAWNDKRSDKKREQDAAKAAQAAAAAKREQQQQAQQQQPAAQVKQHPATAERKTETPPAAAVAPSVDQPKSILDSFTSYESLPWEVKSNRRNFNLHLASQTYEMMPNGSRARGENVQVNRKHKPSKFFLDLINRAEYQAMQPKHRNKELARIVDMLRDKFGLTDADTIKEQKRLGYGQ